MGRSAGPLALGLLVGAALGAGAMAFLEVDRAAVGAGREPTAHAAASRGAIAPFDRPAAADATDVGAPIRATRIASSADETAPPEVVARVAAAARTATLPPPRRGTKSIRGRVLDVDGRPLAGAVVRASREDESRERAPGRSSLGEGAPARASLEEALKRAVQEFYDDRTEERDATTDAQGNYAVEELCDGNWWLHAWCEAFEIDAATRSAVKAGETCDFVAKPVLRLPISVELPDGSPAPRATIRATRRDQAGGEDENGWSPALPWIALLAGDWEVKASLGDPREGPAWPDVLTSEPQLVKLAAGVAAAPLTFRLRGSPGIRGCVREIGGGKAAGVTVKMLPLAAGAAPDLELLADSSSNDRARGGIDALSRRWREGEESELSYVFHGLTSGRYVVGAQREWGGRILAHAVLDVRDQMVVQDLEVPPLDPAAVLTVRVKDPEGRAIDDVTLDVRVETADGGSSGRGSLAKRLCAGTFSIPLESIDDPDHLTRPWPPGTKVTLVAESVRLGETSLVLDSSTRQVDLTFSAPATLVATIEGYAGSGYQGRLRLALGRTDDGKRGSSSLTRGRELGSDGTEMFGPTAAGACRLALILDQPHEYWEDAEVASLDVVLAAGENRATIAIPPLYTLTLELPGATGDSVELERCGGERRERCPRSIDAAGHVAFEELPAGDYVVNHEGKGPSGTMRVRVPSAGVVRFQPAPPNALRVWIRSEEGRLAKAGFQSDDLVVGVDGRDFAAESDPGAVVAALVQKETVTFSVLRGATRLEIAVEGKILTNPFEMGGSLRPTSR